MEKLKIIRKLILGLPLSEAEFGVRGFEVGNKAQERLELVAKTVVHGYNVALETGLSKSLAVNTTQISHELVGFFHEGVAMGLYTLDLFSIGKKDRFGEFITGVGNRHEYMSYIGAGIASAIFRNDAISGFMSKTEKSEGDFLFLNGIGFYHAYFKPEKTLKNNMFVPKSIRGKGSYFLDGYDNGIGRAVWFYNSGEPQKIAKTIAAFPPDRRGGVWAGVGLAATYAGGVSEEKILQLRELSGEYVYRLGEGSVLATHTRRFAGNPHETDTTERILTGKSSVECNDFVDAEIDKMKGRKFINNQPTFQILLQLIRDWLMESHHTSISIGNKKFQENGVLELLVQNPQ
jgi:enediyne biosynthesis protein E3